MFMKKNIRVGYKRREILLNTLYFLTLFFVCNQAFTQALPSNSTPTLKQVLAAAMEISDKSNNKHIQFKRSTWLASSPILGVGHLKSDLKQGTDETEISISLPMKSWLQSDIDEKLYASSYKTQTLLTDNKRLALSGLIREQLWRIKLAEHNDSLLKQKFIFLTELEKQYQQLFQSASISQYPLLLIKKEKLDAQIEQVEVEQTIAQLHQQYKLLTGFTALPKDIKEPFLDNDMPLGQLLTNHPEIKKLDQDWFEKKQQLTLASNQNQPWNLSLNAKNSKTTHLKETQIGVFAEVPLTIFDVKSQSSNSEWLMAKGNYDLSRENRLISLRDTYLSLRSDQKTLLKKNVLLMQARSISKQIIVETQLLIEANQIDQDTAIRRMLTAFNTKSTLTTNKLLLLKNSALLKQAAGISL